jgi:hypothetical protein
MYIKVITIGLSLFFLLFITQGCVKQHKFDEEINKKVILSFNDYMFYPEHLRDTTFAPKYKYVVYVDSSECSPCKIAHMGIYNFIRNELYDKNTGLYLVFSPKKDLIQTLIDTHGLSG